jgi:sialate O-acetylesterase
LLVLIKNMFQLLQIIDNNIELFAATVPNPAYARYAWSDNGVASLFNKEGLPASSFTTE